MDIATKTLTGADIIAAGYKPGKWFKAALEEANATPHLASQIFASHAPAPQLPLTDGKPYHANIRPESPQEEINVAAVHNAMTALMRVPTVMQGAVMPDACPAGEIPVGGVVAAKDAIHPGWHSADICCSMAMSVIGFVDPARVLDIAMGATHFGYGGRANSIPMPVAIERAIMANTYLEPLSGIAHRDFASQGDGNHFLFVGRLKSTGETAIVTHHGSRGLGAGLYKKGMRTAERYRQQLSPQTPKGSAWIPAFSEEGDAYWDALQIVERWTEASHFTIHDLIIDRYNGAYSPLACEAALTDRLFNPHNFVFIRDGLFWHAKGATPGWYPRTLVPLNMAEPILVTRGTNAPNGLGFLPHGAGRNMSRTQYLRENTEHPFPDGIDARFYSGTPDHSELPGAYKSAAQVKAQIAEFNLAEILDEVLPYGSIMAGELPKFWEAKKAQKDTEKPQTT